MAEQTQSEILEGKVLIDVIKQGPVRFKCNGRVYDHYYYHGTKKWLKEQEETAWFVVRSEEGNEFLVSCFELQEQNGQRYIDFDRRVRNLVPLISQHTKIYRELAKTQRELGG